MTSYYNAHAKVKWPCEQTLHDGFELFEQAVKWCEQIIDENKGDCLEAWVDRFRPEPKQEKVWQWPPIKPE